MSICSECFLRTVKCQGCDIAMACGGVWDDCFCAFCTPHSRAKKKLKKMMKDKEAAKKLIQGKDHVMIYSWRLSRRCVDRDLCRSKYLVFQV